MWWDFFSSIFPFIVFILDYSNSLINVPSNICTINIAKIVIKDPNLKISLLSWVIMFLWQLHVWGLLSHSVLFAKDFSNSIDQTHYLILCILLFSTNCYSNSLLIWAELDKLCKIKILLWVMMIYCQNQILNNMFDN